MGKRQRKIPSGSGAIQKPLAIKVIELSNAGRLLRDCIKKLEGGDIVYVSLASAQIRALLTDKSTTPLLLELASVFEVNLSYFCPPIDEMPIKEKMEFSFFPGAITESKRETDQGEHRLSDLPNIKILSFKGKYFTVRTLVEWYAHNSGGAHYSVNLPMDFVDFQGYVENVPDFPSIISSFFVAVSKLLVSCIYRILSKTFSHGIALTILFPRIPDNITIIFDALSDATGMRSLIYVNGVGAMGVHLRSLCGKFIDFAAPPVENHDSPYTFTYALEIESDLSSVCYIYLNKERVAQYRVDFPVMCEKRLGQLESRLNFDESRQNVQDFEFRMGALAAFDNDDASIFDICETVNFMSGTLQDIEGMKKFGKGVGYISKIGTTDFELYQES